MTVSGASFAALALLHNVCTFSDQGETGVPVGAWPPRYETSEVDVRRYSPIKRAC